MTSGVIRFILFIIAVNFGLSIPSLAQDKPNFLFVLMDDFGTDLMPKGVYHHPRIPSNYEYPVMPAVSNLSNQGVVYENAWSMPVCSPSRAALLTGRYPYRHGVGTALRNQVGKRDLSYGEYTLAEGLKERFNYSTAMFGKWHVSRKASDPNTQGFDYFAGTIHGLDDSYYNWPKVVNGVHVGSNVYSSTDLVNESLAWLSRQEVNQPWFMFLSAHVPHNPFHIPPPELADISGLNNLMLKKPVKNARKLSNAMLQAFDTELGRLLSSIDLSKTYIFFMGDNGTDRHVAARPFSPRKSKGTLYQNGVNVPLVVTGPGIAGGGRSKALVNLTDVYSTVFDILESETPPQAVDSISFADTLFQPGAKGEREYNYSETLGNRKNKVESAIVLNGRAVTDGTYKLIITQRTKEMYYLDVDPFEEFNIIAPRRINRLLKREKEAYQRLKAALKAARGR